MGRIFLAAVLATWSVPSYGQQFSVERKWSDLSGRFSVVAGLKSFDEDSVELQKTNGKAIRIPRSRLSKKDLEFISSVDSIKQSEEQAKLIAPHLGQIVERPGATVEIIDALRSEYPNAVGGHLIGGFVYAQAGNESSQLKRSRKCFEDAVDLLTSIEKHFPGLHRKSLASALNNRGVLALRQGQISSGVNYLAQAAEAAESEIPLAVYHNSSMLLNSGIDLGAGKGKLAKILAKGKPESTDVIPDYLMYSLDQDSYLTTTESKQETGSSSQQKINAANNVTTPGKFLVGYGSGLLIAPSLVLTNRHVAEGHSGFRIRNDSGLSIKATTQKVSTSDDIDLAVLALEQPIDAEPFPIRPNVPKIGESFVVLGYPIPQVLEASLTASRGIVSKLVTEDLQILHDASTDPGNSGGPCVDDKGNVIGVHFAGSAIAKNNRNYAISPAAIKMFLTGVKGYAAVPARTETLDFASTIANNRDSVFMIECYSDERITESQSAMPDEPNLLVKHSIFPDRTCLSCFGKGLVDCPACTSGYISKRKTVQVGVNPFTKRPLSGEKSFKSPCSRCSSGKLNCRACGGSGRRK